jgi:hypothetical protein
VGTKALWDGSWWRADDYQLVETDDGLVICPKPGADIGETAPAEDYSAPTRGALPHGRIDVAPHLSFMALGAYSLAHNLDLHGPLPREAENLVMTWVRTNGLPGLLLNMVRRIVFQPRKESSLRMQMSWARDAPSWRGYDRVLSAKETAEPEGVSLEHEEMGIEEIMPLKWLSRFFPVRPQRDWTGLLIYSPEFKVAYGEPLADFFTVAAELHTLTQQLSTMRGMRGDDLDETDEFKVMLWTRRLNELARSGAEQIEWSSPNGYVRRWVGGTLLSSMAHMIIMDLTGTAQYQECSFPGCRAMFVPGKLSQRYCSAQCRNAATRRRQRSRAREGGRE